MTTTKTTVAARPPIQMSDSEADILANLATTIEGSHPEVSEMLMDEITRAKIVRAEKMPADVVTMQAIVRFRDEANGKELEYQLVYPKDADISAGRISILTPVGAGLIGLRTGQSILWPDRDGRQRTLVILDVKQEH